MKRHRKLSSSINPIRCVGLVLASQQCLHDWYAVSRLNPQEPEMFGEMWSKQNIVDATPDELSFVNDYFIALLTKKDTGLYEV